MEDADHSSTSNGRSSHNVGRLGTLIRVFDNSLLTFAFANSSSTRELLFVVCWVGWELALHCRGFCNWLNHPPVVWGPAIIWCWDLYVAE